MKRHKKVNRVEIISQDGREIVLNELVDVEVDMQDTGKTIKIFILK